MNADSILNGLMSVTAWIEDVIINGLLGKGFSLLTGGLGAFLVDMFKLFATMG